MSQNNQKAWIVLADGTVLEGLSFGATGTCIGEVVFNTGMLGYQEVLTDPSYYGQIVMQTYPIIGSAGINQEDMESERAWVSGYIVNEWSETPSNFRCEKTLDEFLKEQNIVSIYGIETRKLTQKIRETGVINGAITTEYSDDKKADLLKQIAGFKIENAVKSVTGKNRKIEGKDATLTVAVLDLGVKNSILEAVASRGAKLNIYGATTSADEIIDTKPDGILISNGAGNPAENSDVIETVKKLMSANIPVLGIGLGHEIMALAQGAKIEKLKYGHRGGNHPVTDASRERTYVTAQNIGYTVVADSINADIAEVSHINENDKTVEGIKYKNIPAFSVSFYPASSGKSFETSYIYDDFIKLMKGDK